MFRIDNIPYWFLVGLLVIISVNSLNRSYFTDDKFLVEDLEKNIAVEIESVHDEASTIIKNAEHDKIFTRLRNDIQHSFFLYHNEKLLYWSDHTIMPDYYLLSSIKSRSIVDLKNGKYLVLKYRFKTGYELYGFIELYASRPVSNDYLYSGFNQKLFSVKEGIDIYIPGENLGKDVRYQDTELFEVNFGTNVNVWSQKLGVFLLLFLFFLVIYISVFVWYKLKTKVKERNFESAMLLWVVYLISIRYILFVFSLPDAIMETGLFESLFFASSRINPSLGDMLINVVIVAAIFFFLFKYYRFSHIVKFYFGARKRVRLLMSFAFILLSFLILTYPMVLIETIYRNSQISMDITQSLIFDFSKIVAFLIVIVSCFTVFLGYHVLFRLGWHPYRNNIRMYLLLLSINGGFQGLLFLFYDVDLVTGSLMAFLLSLLLHFTKVFKNFYLWRYNGFLYLFFVVVSMAVINSFGVYLYEVEREEVNKGRFADYFLIKNDNLTEFFLNETNERIKEDIFIVSRLASPFLSKDVIADKIRQVYLNTIFDKYDISIGIYRDENEFLAGERVESLDLVLTDESKKMSHTEYEGIYFLDNVSGEIGKRYLDQIEIKRRDITVGYIYLDLRLKKVIPNDVYFELLVDNRFAQPWIGKDYNYSIFEGNEMLYNSGNFNYTGSFPLSTLATMPEGEVAVASYQGYNHVGMIDQAGRVVVVSSPEYSIHDIITNFSWFLLVQVSVLLLIASFVSLYRIYNKTSINFSTKIQLYFNFAFFVPMLIVSFITLSSINTIFREEVNVEYNQKARNVSDNISALLDNYISGSIDRDELLDKLLEISRFTNTDINLFSRFGELLATSRPLIYENGLVSKFINPLAYYRIIENNNRQWLAEENVGALNYNNAYYSIRSFRTGSLTGVLSIPFFESEDHLDDQQVEVLSSILTIFTIVFIVFLLISYFVSKGLTFPLRLITQKLKKTSLNQVNEPLNWKSEDEIGMMIGEYNQMLKNLEESKDALARSQKEMAWREMAQQVAHEIKNPLTPMKLTLQHLERKLEGDVGAEAKKPISNLLHHVDTLSDIATSFSSIARMPIPENKPFEVTEILKKCTGIHKNMDSVKISLDVIENNYHVFGDEKLMGRIFSNIILNSAQSGEEGRKVNLNISIEEKKKSIIIEFRDNGSGIEESIAQKIFVPNFTTKEKGSGIGLAIAKHGIEHAGGKIWFESEVGKGTGFYIELMKVEKQ